VRALTGAHEVATLGLRVQVSPTGTVAWAAALLHLRLARGAYTARATWVLEKRPPGGFQVVQLHVSAPMPHTELANAVFGPAPVATPP